MQEQCIDLIETSRAQKQYLKRELPTVHGWVYALTTGHLEGLEISFEDTLEKIRATSHLEAEWFARAHEISSSNPDSITRASHVR